MRNAAFFAVGLLLILIQGHLFRVVGPLEISGGAPDLVLPLIVFLGVHEASTLRGVGLAAALGYAMDILGSAPIGLFTFASVATWGLARVAGVRLAAQTILTQMSLALAFAVVQSVIILVLMAIFGADAQKPVEVSRLLIPHSIATALVAPFVFRVAQRLHQGAARAGEGGEA